MGKITKDYTAPNRIRELRLRKGLTQQQLAEKLNLSASSLGHYENGRRVVDYILAKRLAEMLETDDEYLMGLTDVEYKLHDDFIKVLVDKVKELSADNRNEVLGYIKCLVKHQKK
ncbi:MAG: helix-turn-helix domain-containing protein [Oscillospiraceae bacterium]